MVSRFWAGRAVVDRAVVDGAVIRAGVGRAVLGGPVVGAPSTGRVAAGLWSPVVRNGLGMGLATGAYGLSFGALSVTGGLSVMQTGVLSLLMFTGASQFAFVGVLAGGGGPLASAATALLLGSRNGLYGLHLSRLLGLRGWRRPVGAQLVIDETAGMAAHEADRAAARSAFWVTGVAVYVCWNVATLAGALGAHAMADPGALGLDVVAPAAFLALLAPRMRTAPAWWVALSAGAVALISAPLVPAGVPVLLAALPAMAWALARPRDPRPAAAIGPAAAGGPVVRSTGGSVVTSAGGSTVGPTGGSTHISHRVGDVETAAAR